MKGWFLLLAWCAYATAAVAQTPTDTVYVPGQTYFGRNMYVEYYAGNTPYILSAPHGGLDKPAEIPDRTYGETTLDSYTQDVARDFIAAVLARTGKHPHVIVCRLARVKLDANRDSVEGAQGNPYALQAWQEWHRYIEAARKAVVATYGKGLYVDLHGHGHTIQRLELGYLLSSAQLSLSADSLNSTRMSRSTSVRALATTSPDRLSGILRGPRSLGTFLEHRGFPSVPSTMQPSPGSNPYFTGGYNTERHGSLNGGTIDGIQIESNYTNVRDTDANRKRYAAAMAEAFDYYTQIHHFGTTYSPASLVLNEVMFDLPREDTTTVIVEGDANGDGVRGVRGDEFVEIVNGGSLEVQIGGYRILERDMRTVFTFPDNATLGPGEFAVVFGGVGPAGFGASLPARAKLFAAKPGQADSGFYVSSAKTNLLTAGDNIVLLHPPSNEVLDEVCWGSAQIRSSKGRKLIAPNTLHGDSIAGAIAQSVTRWPDVTGLWATHLSLTSLAPSYSPGRSAVTSVAVENDVRYPSGFLLEQNYPNPFNPRTDIKFRISGYSAVTLKVIDILGREVRTLADESMSPGTYTVSFDATGLTSGVYVYRLSAGSLTDVKKMVLAR